MLPDTIHFGWRRVPQPGTENWRHEKFIRNPELQTAWKWKCVRNLRLKLMDILCNCLLLFMVAAYYIFIGPYLWTRSIAKEPIVQESVIIKDASRTKRRIFTGYFGCSAEYAIGQPHQSLIRSTCHLQQHRKAEEAPVAPLIASKTSSCCVDAHMYNKCIWPLHACSVCERATVAQAIPGI